MIQGFLNSGEFGDIGYFLFMDMGYFSKQFKGYVMPETPVQGLVVLLMLPLCWVCMHQALVHQ